MITLKVRTPDGKVESAGSLSSFVLRAGHSTAPQKVPHLVRLDSGNNHLASYDDRNQQIQLRSLGDKKNTSIINVRGTHGKVQAFRWLFASQGLVIVTDRNVYVALFDPTAPPRKLTFRPVLRGRKTSYRNIGARALPSGLVVQRSQYSWSGGDIFFVPIDGTSVGKFQRILPTRKRWAVSMGVLSDDRFVVTAGHRGANDLQLRTYRIDADKRAQLISTAVCENNQCNVMNWSPHSGRPVYVQGYGQLSIVAWHDDTTLRPLIIALPKKFNDAPVFWQSRDESRYLVGDGRRLGMWDKTGKQLWLWRAPENRMVHGAHFTADGSVIAAVGLSIVLIRDGKAKKLMVAKGAHAEAKWLEKGAPRHKAIEATRSAHSFAEDPVLLPDGSVAYSVVDVVGSSRSNTSGP